MNPGVRERILESVSAVLSAALPDAWAVYVYGCVARADDRPDSDLDIAVLLPPKAQIPDKLALMAELSCVTGREVDVVSLRDASLDLVHDVLRTVNNSRYGCRVTCWRGRLSR